jgi:hypothetical protein
LYRRRGQAIIDAELPAVFGKIAVFKKTLALAGAPREIE